MAPKTKDKKQKRVEIEVPVEESDIKVVDIRLSELVALIAICGTLAALGFTYYTYVKSKAEAKKMESIAKVISAGIKGVADVFPKDVIIDTPKVTTRMIKTSVKKAKGAARA